MITFFVAISALAIGVVLGRRVSATHIEMADAKCKSLEWRSNLYKEEAAKWRRAAIKVAESCNAADEVLSTASILP